MSNVSTQIHLKDIVYVQYIKVFKYVLKYTYVSLCTHVACAYLKTTPPLLVPAPFGSSRVHFDAQNHQVEDLRKLSRLGFTVRITFGFNMV